MKARGEGAAEVEMVQWPITMNCEQCSQFQMFKLDLEKAEKPEIKLPTSFGSSKKAREFQKNIYFCFID